MDNNICNTEYEISKRRLLLSDEQARSKIILNTSSNKNGSFLKSKPECKGSGYGDLSEDNIDLNHEKNEFDARSLIDSLSAIATKKKNSFP